MHERNVEQFFSRNTSYWESVYTNQEQYGLAGAVMRSRRNTVIDVVDHFAGDRKLRILDVGCGPGIILEAMLARGHHVRGVDVSIEMAKEANERLNKRPLRGDSYCLQGNVEALPFEAESMDVVLCLGVLMYLRDERRALSEISRVLKPDGMAVVVLTNLFKIGNLFDPYYYVCRSWQYLWHQVLNRKQAVVDRSVSPREFGANNNFAIKRYALHQVHRMFNRNNLLYEVRSIGNEYGPPTFWRKRLMPDSIERTTSSCIQMLTRRNGFSWLKVFANEWIIVLGKSAENRTPYK
jgi:ubiquinone/menaquinone biosynthesis C-methylase UbiE